MPVDPEISVQVRGAEAEVREDDVLPAPANAALPATKGNNDVPRFSIKTHDIL
jgi:hypothetical protein